MLLVGLQANGHRRRLAQLDSQAHQNSMKHEDLIISELRENLNSGKQVQRQSLRVFLAYGEGGWVSDVLIQAKQASTPILRNSANRNEIRRDLGKKPNMLRLQKNGGLPRSTAYQITNSMPTEVLKPQAS